MRKIIANIILLTLQLLFNKYFNFSQPEITSILLSYLNKFANCELWRTHLVTNSKLGGGEQIKLIFQKQKQI